MEAGTPYIGPYLITKCHSQGMYRLQLVGDKSSTIERISSAYLKPYKVQHKHGCIETSARHVYVSNIVPAETFNTENNGSIAIAKNANQEDPQQCQDRYESDNMKQQLMKMMIFTLLHSRSSFIHPIFFAYGGLVHGHCSLRPKKMIM